MKKYISPTAYTIDTEDICEGVNPGSPTDRFDAPQVHDLYEDVMEDGVIDQQPSIWER